MDRKPWIIPKINYSDEDRFMRDTINYLRNNNIVIFSKDNGYKGVEAIMAEVRAKFENS